ncbi:hypothetical protein PHLH8_08280 [Pseudomonas sp. Pc102]|uniref:hypothetical protein n=1 Tax=Pseudomonas sp. Pc102 TaxID=2678261 RepID=UPI001BCF6C9A|nr:hypothetical protein [Pseudomonas sp. Pc102]BBP81186.1 hypothetical protein PHLH8_08280 [Pseudomonas sp. Pc102]
MNETSNERHQRLAMAAAAAWKEVADLVAKNPDMRRVENVDLLFRLQSAAEQAGWAYWENVEEEDAMAAKDELA